MGAKTGILCLIKVNTAADGAAATYVSVAGQRDATLKLDGKEVDTTSKDSAGWEENIPGNKSWTMEGDGLFIEDDTAAGKLESQFIAGKQILAQVVMPGGGTYSGLATITSLEIKGPHDKEMTSKFSLKGSGALTPA